MLYVVLFEDNPQIVGDVRQRHMPQHLAFLERNKSFITAAGPLRTTEGEPAGGLWLLEAETPNDVVALVQEDPFWPTGLRKSFRILAWSQVFADGKRLL